MKLTYRGQSYSIPAPVQFGADANSTDQPKVKLIYRGQTYYATPCPADVNPAAATTGSTVTLRYRGITYQRVLQEPKPYHPSQAINWRYRFGQ
jgi:hypothetical protein